MAQTLHSQPSQFNWACIAATGPEALNPMSLISAESNMLFDRALDNSHLDVGTTGFPMDPMSRTFSMPETQSNTDARNMFDTTDCYSEQSFGPAISVDSFDFDILDSQDDFGGANPVTTWSTPHSPYSCEFDGISIALSGCTDTFDASLLEPIRSALRCSSSKRFQQSAINSSQNDAITIESAPNHRGHAYTFGRFPGKEETICYELSQAII